MKLNIRGLFPTLLLLGCITAAAQEKIYRVALIAHSPPLSYTDAAGKFTGFNVEMATELCATMKIRCVQQPLPVDKIVDMAATDQIDFAVVGFIPTPERKARVLFSKVYFQSMSVWMGRPSVAAGNSRSSVAVIKGSAQASHAQAMGWKTTEVATNADIASVLSSGTADAAVLPMLGALSLAQGSTLLPLGLKSTVLSGPLITGTLHMVINPKQAEMTARINAAIDQIKLDGRFDRINSRFVPFSLL